MAVRLEDSDEEVGAAVSLGIEGEKIKAEKEQKVQKLTDPRRPTQAEVDDHNRTHLPYRNWCPHCVQGKGKDLDHRKSTVASTSSASTIAFQGMSSGSS